MRRPLSALPLLVSFMPMLMDTAGNCGNQISTLMVRGLALGEVEPSDFLRVLGKELRVSAIVGAVLGIVNGLRIYLMYTFLFPGQYANVMGYAIVVSVSLFFSVILAKLVGGMLPLAAKEAGCRPGHHGYPLHHHHRGCLQPDPVFPDRTAGVPQYDVNNKAMPDGLEVTARHFYRTNPLSLRSNSLSQNLGFASSQGAELPLPLGKLSPTKGRLRGFSRDKNSVENCNFPRLFHTEKRQRPGVENLGPVHSRLEKNKSPLRNGL